MNTRQQANSTTVYNQVLARTERYARSPLPYLTAVTEELAREEGRERRMKNEEWRVWMEELDDRLRRRGGG